MWLHYYQLKYSYTDTKPWVYKLVSNKTYKDTPTKIYSDCKFSYTKLISSKELLPPEGGLSTFGLILF